MTNEFRTEAQELMDSYDLSSEEGRAAWARDEKRIKQSIDEGRESEMLEEREAERERSTDSAAALAATREELSAKDRQAQELRTRVGQLERAIGNAQAQGLRDSQIQALLAEERDIDEWAEVDPRVALAKAKELQRRLAATVVAAREETAYVDQVAKAQMVTSVALKLEALGAGDRQGLMRELSAARSDSELEAMAQRIYANRGGRARSAYGRYVPQPQATPDERASIRREIAELDITSPDAAKEFERIERRLKQAGLSG